MKPHTHPGTCPDCPETCELCDGTGRVYEFELPYLTMARDHFTCRVSSAGVVDIDCPRCTIPEDNPDRKRDERRDEG